MITRADAEAYDRRDPLAPTRDEFVVADPDLIYLDGNSLGRLPVRTVDAVQRTMVDGWGRGLVRSWAEWIDLGAETGDRLAHLIGAEPGEVILADQTSVNLFKLASAAMDDSTRPLIVTDDGNFPSDRYVLAEVARRVKGDLVVIETDPVAGPTVDDLDEAVDGDVALVSLSHVSYRSAAIADMAGITEIAHDRGALTLWDLSHSAGALAVELANNNADLAVGCTYKYLNGGPGAPAFMYVRSDLQERLRQPIHGWFGHADQFGFDPRYTPANDLRRFTTGTPPILSMIGAMEGIALSTEIGIGRLRIKSKDLTKQLVEHFDDTLFGLGFGLASPRDAEARGSHIALVHNDAYRISRALLDYRVIPDFRAPDVLRLGVAPAYTSAVEVWDAMERLTAIVEAGTHKDYPEARARVT